MFTLMSLIIFNQIKWRLGFPYYYVLQKGSLGTISGHFNRPQIFQKCLHSSEVGLPTGKKKKKKKEM